MAHHLECCTQPWRKILLLASHFLLHSQHLYLHFLKLKDEDTVKKWRTHLCRHLQDTLTYSLFKPFFSHFSLTLYDYLISSWIGSFPKANVKTWSVVFLTDLNFLDCGFLEGWTPCWDGQLCLRPIYMAQRCCWTDILSLNRQLYKMDTSVKRTPGDDPCLFLLL